MKFDLLVQNLDGGWKVLNVLNAQYFFIYVFIFVVNVQGY